MSIFLRIRIGTFFSLQVGSVIRPGEGAQLGFGETVFLLIRIICIVGEACAG